MSRRASGNRRHREAEALFREMAGAWRASPEVGSVRLEEVTRAGLAGVQAHAVAWGWMLRLIRTGEAVLRLHRAGFNTETSPLARSMIEHVVGMLWLSDMPNEALQSLLRGRQEQLRLLEEAQTDGWALPEHALTATQAFRALGTDGETKRIDYLGAFKHQAQRYKLGNLYMGWLVETSTAHCSFASATAYYSEGPPGAGNETNIRLHTEPGDELHERPLLAAIALHLALTAYNDLNPVPHVAARLENWETRIAALPGLNGSDATHK